MLISCWLITAICPLAARGLAQSEPVAVRPVHTPPPLDTTTIVPEEQQRPNCWRAQSRPPCNGFFLTDLGIELPLRSTHHVDPADPAARGGRHADFQTRLVWTFGFMATKGRHSHGGAVSITSEETRSPGIPNVIEWRYRNWLGASAAVDVGVGYKANEVWAPGVGLVGARGVTAMLAYTPMRYVGVSVRADLVRARGRDHRALLVGLQSTRLSEVMIKHTFLLIIRTMLGAIGVEVEEE